MINFDNNLTKLIYIESTYKSKYITIYLIDKKTSIFNLNQLCSQQYNLLYCVCSH